MKQSGEQSAGAIGERFQPAGFGAEAVVEEVRLIDFGLALKQNVVEGVASTLRQGKSVAS